MVLDSGHAGAAGKPLASLICPNTDSTIHRTRLQAAGDNDLMRALDRDLGGVAGDNCLGTWRRDANIGTGEIAVGAIGRTILRITLRFAAQSSVTWAI
jgi:hypothetical protein